MDTQTFIIFSLVVDVILIITMILPWLHERDDWHALFWAAGQAGITCGSGLAFQQLPQQLNPLLSAGLLTISISGFWAGTEYFIGNLRRKHVMPIAAASALFCLLLTLFFFNVPAMREATTKMLLGTVILWSGIRVLYMQRHFRLLGMILIIRGGYNLLTVMNLIPDRLDVWFMFGLIVKTSSTLCLIYAVLEKIRERYASTIDCLSNGLLILNMDGIIHVINERGARLLGYSSTKGMAGSPVVNHVNGLDAHAVKSYFKRFAAAAGNYPLVENIVVLLPDKGQVPLELISSPYYERGRPYCMVQMMDISERKQKEAILHKAAHYDDLTGLFNRHGFSQELARVIAQSQEKGQECAVLLVDIDRFKRINDSFGHLAGEQLLREIGGRLQRALPDNSLAARFGGDEFAIAMYGLEPGSAAQTAAICGDDLFQILTSGIPLLQQNIQFSASIGVTCIPEHGTDTDAVIQHAYIAMYDGKKAGRNQLRFFSSSMISHAREAVIDTALRSAISSDELYLLYQPVANAKTGRIDKVEALLRWNSRTLNNVSPDHFIPIAEESGIIVEIGTWVLNQACWQLAEWQASGVHLTMCVNVSASQLLDTRFITYVERALQINQLNPAQLELELTERVLIDDGAHVRTTLNHLRAMGVRLSLDDFGTGYSSLSYLTQFHLNTLKIDRSFVMALESSARHQSLVSTIIAMGHNLDLELVAEGVETEQQISMLQKMGCHYLQGYYISRPIAAENIPLICSSPVKIH